MLVISLTLLGFLSKQISKTI